MGNRAKFLFTLVSVIVLFSVCMFACDNCDDKKSAEQYDTDKFVNCTESEQAFVDYIKKIDELEKLSESYKKDNKVQLRVANYIRSVRYDDGNWNIAAGVVDKEFASYVKNTKPELEVLRTTEEITINDNVKIDLIHLWVAIACMLYTNNDMAYATLAGWGGDTCQFAAKYKASTAETDEEIAPIIESNFGWADFYADVDAVNIYAHYKTVSNHRITSAMVRYYLMVFDHGEENSNAMKTRKILYLSNAFGLIQSENEPISAERKAQLIEFMYQSIKQNGFLIIWGYGNGLSVMDDVEFIKYGIEHAVLDRILL